MARIWVGNAVTVWTHYDLSSNIACVVAGKRRFTPFPPHQVASMYVGPLEFTLAGQPVSLVDLDAPDYDRYDRYPRFRGALEHAQVAELEPGDAVFIPHLWWHHVKSLDRFNVLVNYWWDDAKPWAGSPFEALVHALLSIRDLPPSHRQAWRTIFDHYIFQADEDPAAPHSRRGTRCSRPTHTRARISNEGVLDAWAGQEGLKEEADSGWRLGRSHASMRSAPFAHRSAMPALAQALRAFVRCGCTLSALAKAPSSPMCSTDSQRAAALSWLEVGHRPMGIGWQDSQTIS